MASLKVTKVYNMWLSQLAGMLRKWKKQLMQFGGGAPSDATSDSAKKRSSYERKIKPYHSTSNSHPSSPSGVPSPVHFGGNDSDAASTPKHQGSSSAFTMSTSSSPVLAPRRAAKDVYIRDPAPFLSVMAMDPVNMDELRQLSWHGCPVNLRAQVWMLLTGYWLSAAANRAATLARKRAEYVTYLERNYGLVDWDSVCAGVEGGPDRVLQRSVHQQIERQRLHEQQQAREPGTPCASPAEANTSDFSNTATPATAAGGAGGDTRGVYNGREGNMPRKLRSVTSLEDLQNALAVKRQDSNRDADGHGGGIGASRATPAAARGAHTQRISVGAMIGSNEGHILKQIRKDIPRMAGRTSYLQHPRVQGSIERVLFTWALRHPACGYVQGMNDLIVPFIEVILADRFCPTKSVTELHAYDMETLDHLWSDEAVPANEWVGEIEADTYWVASYLLNGMQDSYTLRQSAVVTMVEQLAAIIRAADVHLYTHLVKELELDFCQFSFRWMNCLLLRELSTTQSVQLLDAYLSDEERRWSTTHVYVCAALMLRWATQLLDEKDFGGALHFLQNPPTEKMSSRDMSEIISEAFLLESLYASSVQLTQGDDVAAS